MGDFVSSCDKVSAAAVNLSKLVMEFTEEQLVLMQEHTRMLAGIHNTITTLESALDSATLAWTKGTIRVALQVLKAAVDQKKPGPFSKDSVNDDHDNDPFDPSW